MNLFENNIIRELLLKHRGASIRFIKNKLKNIINDCNDAVFAISSQQILFLF